MTTIRATVHGSARRSAAIVAAALVIALAIWALARLLGVDLIVGTRTPLRLEPPTCW